MVCIKFQSISIDTECINTSMLYCDLLDRFDRCFIGAWFMQCVITPGRSSEDIKLYKLLLK